MESKTRDLTNWDEFVCELCELQSLQEKRESQGCGSELLFRGHADADWRLETTLERDTNTGWSLDSYYRRITAVKSQLESVTGDYWDLPRHEDFCEWLAKLNADPLAWYDYPGYEYMIYLRHHGFPSPLLDWTHSAYVAAFFAFRDAKSKRNDRRTDRVAVFVLCERLNGSKHGSNQEATIRNLGSFRRTHRRHFLQQSAYTICTILDGQWNFGSHEDVFTRNEPSQDLLWKFTIPIAEQSRVLRTLDQYNLNAFSLFETQEALMQTIARRLLF